MYELPYNQFVIEIIVTNNIFPNANFLNDVWVFKNRWVLRTGRCDSFNVNRLPPKCPDINAV